MAPWGVDPAAPGAAGPATIAPTAKRAPPIRIRAFMRCLPPSMPTRRASGRSLWRHESLGNESVVRALGAGEGRAWYDLSGMGGGAGTGAGAALGRGGVALLGTPRNPPGRPAGNAHRSDAPGQETQRR